MPKYDVLGGGRIEATTDLGIVQALRQDAQDWVPSVSIEDFMEGMASRAKIQNGATIRIDTVAHFVADLKQYGFLTPIS